MSSAWLVTAPGRWLVQHAGPGIRGALRRLGFELFTYRPRHHYVADYYGAGAPHRRDVRDLPIFGPLAAAAVAEGRTQMNVDRLYVLYQLLENAARLAGPGVAVALAEVGVYRGGTSAFLLRAAAALGLPIRALHCVDTFEGHSALDVLPEKDPSHRAAFFADTSFQAVRELLAPFPNAVVHQGRIQDRAAQLAGETFAMVHLDVDLYGPTLFGLRFFSRRLSPGGCIVVDDYGSRMCPGVDEAVAEFLAESPAFFSIHPLSKQCVLVNTRPADSSVEGSDT